MKHESTHTTNTEKQAIVPTTSAEVVSNDQSLIAAIRARTPARLMLDRRGGSYRTSDQVTLRQDHAAAIDAVWRTFEPNRDWGDSFCRVWQFLETESAAATKEEYLRRPDLGRIFSTASAARIRNECPLRADLQIVVGDGLSAAAAARQVPRLVPLLATLAHHRGWTLGRMIVVQHCRVGIVNQIGEILSPNVVVLLIGERPGLQTDDSLSAYLAYRPAAHHTDSRRNLISNIHDAGTRPESASQRIVALAAELMRCGTSGPTIKEVLGPKGLSHQRGQSMCITNDAKTFQERPQLPASEDRAEQ